MGGGSSKWKKISMGPLEPGEYSKASSAEEGDGQPPGEVGKSGGGGQQRPVQTERKEVGNSQHNTGTTSEDRRKGDGSDSPVDEENIDQELDRALAECEDWRVNSNRKLEPGSCPRSNTYTWSNSKPPCGEPGFNSAPYIQSLAGQGDTAAAASPEKPEPLLGSVKVQLPRGQSQRGERDPAAQYWARALTNSNLNINHWNQQHLRHDLLTISTQDIENNNLANGFHINGKNMSPNSAPILYDYSEQELMASIENEYS